MFSRDHVTCIRGLYAVQEICMKTSDEVCFFGDPQLMKISLVSTDSKMLYPRKAITVITSYPTNVPEYLIFYNCLNMKETTHRTNGGALSKFNMSKILHFLENRITNGDEFVSLTLHKRFTNPCIFPAPNSVTCCVSNRITPIVIFILAHC
jgi:hypothetical protein